MRKKLSYITHRPYGPLQKKIIGALYSSFDVEFVVPIFTSQVAPLVAMKKDIGTAVRLLSLGLKALLKRDNILLDFMDCIFYPHELKSNRLVLEASTPLHIEMKWLKYPRVIWNLAKYKEAEIVQNADLLFTPNELMENYYRSLGAKKTIIIPNYPTRSFRIDHLTDLSRARYDLPSEALIALFIGGGHMREIYGLDLLLRSWQIVEKSMENVYLFVVGPAPNDISEQVASLKLKNIIFCGVMDSNQIRQLISDCTVCLAPRTPGFPTHWYNDKDSTKISEYAAYSKPIVACGYSNNSTQYHLTLQTPEEYAAGILRGFYGRVPRATPHFWEDNIGTLRLAIHEAAK